MTRLDAGFTDRRGGVSAPPFAELNLSPHVGDDPAAVAENRRRVAAARGVGADAVVWMRQVHGRAVAVVDGPADEPVADALVTSRPGLWLGALVADCAPVLLADTEAGVIAAVHAGRRGLVAGVLPAAVETMTGLGADPGRLTAWIGPAIGGCCYELPADLAAAVVADVPAAAARTRAGTPAIDIRAGLRAQLAAAGVTALDVSAVCTADEAALYSHRRDGTTGRFAGLIGIEPG